jgi:hypothetical protein
VEEQLAAPEIPLSTDLGRRFLYARYNADLSGRGLKRLGFTEVDPSTVQKMDAVAGESVQLAHFGSFI